MSLTVKENPYTFVLPPEGLHIARCYAVIDLGKQFNKFYLNTLPKILIGWEFPDTLMQSGKPFIQYQRYTASLNEKSSLRALLEAWQGRAFLSEELDGFELKKLLGKPCYLTTKQVLNPNTQQRWSKVMSVCPLPEFVSCPPLSNSLLHFDLDDYSESSYQALPEGIRKIINLQDSKFVNSNSAPIQPSQAMASQQTIQPAYDPDEPQPDVEL